MAIAKRTLIAGAAVAAIGMATVGGVGLASAATSTDSTTSGTSIVDKIATKFNLNKDEVKAVFDEDRTEHQAEMKQRQTERLAQAVTDGKLTQEQADYITKAMEEIQALIGTASPEDEDDTVREQIKTKMDALRTWAEDNGVDMRYVGPGGHGGFGGPGRDGGQRPVADDSSDSSTEEN